MTELSFLIDLLLNHKLAKSTKDLIAKRIGEIQKQVDMSNVSRVTTPMGYRITEGAMVNQGPIIVPTMPPPNQVVNIAQTPAVAAAMEERNAIINGKRVFDKDKGGPRKW